MRRLALVIDVPDWVAEDASDAADDLLATDDGAVSDVIIVGARWDGQQPINEALRSLLERAGWQRFHLSPPFGLGGAIYLVKPDSEDAIEAWIPPTEDT